MAGRTFTNGSGGNSRLDTLQAAVLSAKLAVLDEWNGLRGRVAAAYRSQLPPSIAPVAITPGADSALPPVRGACARIAIGSVPRSLIGISRPGSTTPCRATGMRPYRAFARRAPACGRGGRDGDPVTPDVPAHDR